MKTGAVLKRIIGIVSCLGAAAFFGYMSFRLTAEFFQKEEWIDSDSH